MNPSTNSKRFYIDSTTGWRAVAERHVEDQDDTGTLARALVTLIDAYDHARKNRDNPCPQCHGLQMTCSQCHGSGYVDA